MKVLAVNTSPRTDGNTFHMLKTVLEVCEKADCETEIYQAGGKPVTGCLACGGCSRHKGVCTSDDWINELYPKMLEAQAIIIGSPTYFADVSSECKAIIDRCGFMACSDSKAFSRKIGAAVSAVRRAGSIHTLNSIQNFFLMNDMIVPGSTYWNLGIALGKGEFVNDTEGVRTMKRLGENIVWLLGKIY